MMVLVYQVVLLIIYDSKVLIVEMYNAQKSCVNLATNLYGSLLSPAIHRYSNYKSFRSSFTSFVETRFPTASI